jgi:hypothetical protein
MVVAMMVVTTVAMKMMVAEGLLLWCHHQVDAGCVASRGPGLKTLLSLGDLSTQNCEWH